MLGFSVLQDFFQPAWRKLCFSIFSFPSTPCSRLRTRGWQLVCCRPPTHCPLLSAAEFSAQWDSATGLCSGPSGRPAPLGASTALLDRSALASIRDTGTLAMRRSCRAHASSGVARAAQASSAWEASPTSQRAFLSAWSARWSVLHRTPRVTIAGQVDSLLRQDHHANRGFAPSLLPPTSLPQCSDNTRGRGPWTWLL